MENWIIPCNIRVDDVLAHFERKDTIVMGTVASLKKGDIAYLYLGAPFSQIKFRCHVLSDEIDDATLSENNYAIRRRTTHRTLKYIMLQLDYTYPTDMLSLSELKKHGLCQIQIQSHVNHTLQSYLDGVNKHLGVLSTQ